MNLIDKIEFRNRERLVAYYCKRAETYSNFTAAAGIVAVLCVLAAAWMRDPSLLVSAVLSVAAGVYCRIRRSQEYRKANEAQAHLAEWIGERNIGTDRNS